MAPTLAVGWFWLYPPDHAATARTAAAAAFGLADIEIGWGQNDFAPVVQNALTHTWSLGVEEQFCLLWPFVLAAFVRARLIWWFGLASSVTVGGLLWAVAVQQADPAWAFFRPDARAWETAAGAALAIGHALWTAKAAEGEERSYPVSVAVFALSARLARSWGCASSGPPERRTPAWGTVPVIVAALLALHAGSGIRLPQDGSAWAWVVARCGALSHALYLVHWPVFVVWRSIAGLPFAPLAAVGALALSVALAWALHRLVEVPFRRPRPERAWRAVSATVVLLLGVALVGGKVFLGRGVPERIPPEIQALGSHDEGVLSQARRRRFCFRAGEDPAGIGACLRGYRGQAAGDPAWAIWGDSHATSLVAGMMLNPGSSSFLGFGASGCPPLARMATQGHRQCHLVGARVLEVLEQTPSVRTAVLHAR